MPITKHPPVCSTQVVYPTVWGQHVVILGEGPLLSKGYRLACHHVGDELVCVRVGEYTVYEYQTCLYTNPWFAHSPGCTHAPMYIHI